MTALLPSSYDGAGTLCPARTVRVPAAGDAAAMQYLGTAARAARSRVATARVSVTRDLHLCLKRLNLVNQLAMSSDVQLKLGMDCLCGERFWFQSAFFCS